MKNKITGEEKHYQKLNTRLQQELNKETERVNRLYEANYKMAKEMTDLENRIATLERENGFLKEKLGLSDDEIKKLIRASAGIDMIARNFNYGW